MKSYKAYIMLLVAMLSLCVADMDAKSKRQNIFVFGVSTSFEDSTVYLTDIQEIPNVLMDSKTNFIYDIRNYSYQLNTYMEGIGEKDRVCVMEYALKRKDIEKKYLKLKKRYSNAKNGVYTIKYLTPSDFKYEVVEVAEEMVEPEVQQPQKPEKGKKKSKKPAKD